MAATDATLNVAFISIPLSGHMNPVMLIALAMAARKQHVAVFTFEQARSKYEDKVKGFGGTFVGLPCEKSEQEFLDEAANNGIVPFNLMREHMHQGLLDAMRSFRPNIMVTDGMTLAPMDVSEELEVPLVINIPGPVQQVQQGLKSGFSDAGPYNVDKVTFQDHIAPRFRKSYARALIAVNSFFGLEPLASLTSNIVVTGSLASSLAPAEISRSEHATLFTFLENATQIVYVTTGSMVHLPEWLVRVIFDGLQRVGCFVIWSLPSDVQKFVPEQCDRFYIESWLPQPALLHHPKVAAVITHCGWSAVHECVAGAKPVLPLPFQADQPFNAELLIESGMGARLAPTPSANVDHSGGSAYEVGMLTAESVTKAVRQVLDNQTYRERAESLRELSKKAGGADGLAARIEHAAGNGLEPSHEGTTDISMERKRKLEEMAES